MFGRPQHVAGLLAALALVGCGSRVTITAEQDKEPTKVPGFDEPEPSFACTFEDAERPMLAARIDNQLYFVRRDGSSEAVLDIEVPDGGRLARNLIIARGDYVALQFIITPIEEGAFDSYAELVVLDVDGNVVVQRRDPFAYGSAGLDDQLRGRGDGLFVATRNDVKSSLNIATQGATPVPFPERLIALSDPDVSSRLVVRPFDTNSTATLHFLDLSTQQDTPTDYLSDESRASSPAILGGGIAYLAREPARVVFETPDGTTEQSLPITLDPFGHASKAHDIDGDWTLFRLGGDASKQFVAVHPPSGDHRAIELAIPDGWSFPPSTGLPPIDAEGRLLVTLYSGKQARLHRTSDGLTLEPVGQPMDVGDYGAEILQAGGAVVFSRSYGGEGQLVGPQGGEGVAILRWDGPGSPDNPIYGDDVLSPDGSCLAYYRSGELHVAATEDYSITNLGLAPASSDAEAAFIPLAEP